MKDLVYQGSVKDIYSIDNNDNDLIFKFSDRYSIFDWGEMPDKLEGKGKTLSFYTHFIFSELANPDFWERIEKTLPKDLYDTETYRNLCSMGVKSHLINYCDENGQTQEQITSNLRVKKVDVLKPRYIKEKSEWDYTAYSQKNEQTQNCLVPLEVIFRFGVPRGSSILKRVKNEEYAKELGLAHMPVEGEKFNRPVVEFSTKLEEKDRYLSRKDAYSIAGLSAKEQNKLEELSTLLSYGVKYIFDQVDIELWDGKFEFAFCKSKAGDENRDLMLVDAIGPDELRLSYKEMPLSKENMRQCYIGSPWHLAVNKSKELAKERGSINWKDICLNELKQSPPRLSEEKIESFQMLYKVVAIELAKKFKGETNLFKVSWDLGDLRQRLKGLGL